MAAAEALASLSQRYGYYLKHSVREVRARKVAYCLGFTSCLLVVTVVALAGTALFYAPVVFLRLAEEKHGEYDFVLSPSSTPFLSSTGDLVVGGPTLNYTLLADEVLSSGRFSSHAPRFSSQSNVFPLSACAGAAPDDPAWGYDGARNGTSLCDFGVVGRMRLIDTARERKIGIGRDFPFPVPLPRGQVLISDDLAVVAGVGVGDEVYLEVDLGELFEGPLNSAAADAGLDASLVVEYGSAHVPVTVGGVLSSPYGKYPSSARGVVLAEFDWMVELLAERLDPEMPSALADAVSQDIVLGYAHEVLVNLPNPRVNYYLETDYDRLQAGVVEFASELVYLVGYGVVSVDSPLLTEIELTRFFSLFLGLLLDIVIFVLIVLSIILIYSLMMVSVETRTFETGVLRMVGMTRAGVVQLLVVQALLYAVPSWILGLILARIANGATADAFESWTHIPLDPELRANPVLMATFLGLCIPLVASVFPIRQALRANLHDSLDVRRNKVKPIRYSLERAEDAEQSASVFVLGAGMALFGFLVYYLFPLALLSFNLTLLLNIFFFILLGMLAGLVILSLNVQHLAESAILFALFFWEQTPIRKVVAKNLVAHRARNRKTFMMYSLSLGFIIFVAVSYAVQIETFTYQLLQLEGARYKIDDTGRLSMDDVAAIEDVLEANIEAGRVEAYTWVSHSIHFSTETEEVILENLGHVYRRSVLVAAASPNFFEVAERDFLIVNSRRKSRYALAESMYTPRGSSGVMLATIDKTELGLNYEQDFLLRFVDGPPPQLVRLRASAFLDLAPLFYFTKYPTAAGERLDAVVSFPTWLRLTQGQITSMEDVPLSQCLVKLTGRDSDAFKREMDELVRDLPARTWDYDKEIEPVNDANEIINLFFGFTTVLAMTVCFFSLASSMYANIYEQSKEIGILRAMGVGRGWIRRVYVYEAFVLIFAASFMGIIIGTIVGWTMTIQRQIFTQLPIAFAFPYSLLALVFFMSIVFAFLSSFQPAYSLSRRSIVAIMRTLT